MEIEPKDLIPNLQSNRCSANNCIRLLVYNSYYPLRILHVKDLIFGLEFYIVSVSVYICGYSRMHCYIRTYRLEQNHISATLLPRE